MAPVGWHPDSWQARTTGQIPSYRDQARAASVMGELARLPPLVTSWEVDALREQLAMPQWAKPSFCRAGIAQRPSPTAVPRRS